MTTRPTVNVFGKDGAPTGDVCPLPAVLTAPIRPDIVQFVHTSMAKNRRQAYSVKVHNGPMGIVAGHQHSAHSWGTGRAVSRIPRVSGGGTHRAGQGAFGNMCRGGRMFNPTKIWRKWHKKINLKQKRYATASALAASALPALVMARGHRIDEVEEVPLVVDDLLESIETTKEALATLQKLYLEEELERCTAKHRRAGRGKMRNRRWRNRVGPLVVYKEDNKIVQAFRNIRGVDTCQVTRLNLLQLAPGGHVGRLIIWTKSAFEMLDTIFGTEEKPSTMKSGFVLPRSNMTNSDLTRVINSQEIQAVLRPKGPRRTRGLRRKKNALKNLDEMRRLNPHAEELRRKAIKARSTPKKKRARIDDTEFSARKRAKAEFAKTFNS